MIHDSDQYTGHFTVPWIYIVRSESEKRVLGMVEVRVGPRGGMKRLRWYLDGGWRTPRECILKRDWEWLLVESR